jgi:hypothetical protein
LYEKEEAAAARYADAAADVDGDGLLTHSHILELPACKAVLRAATHVQRHTCISR